LLGFILEGKDSILIIPVLLPNRRSYVNLQEVARFKTDIRTSVRKERVRLHRCVALTG
jgi:hypothetical protein